MGMNKINKTNVVNKKKRLPVFAERFYALQDGRSNKKMGEFLGISSATVGYYANGDRLPNAEDLKNICQKCSVSADWLLGLSDVRSPDIDTQAICKKTGLSEEAVINLSLNATLQEIPAPEFQDMLGGFIFVDDFLKHAKWTTLVSYVELKRLSKNVENFIDPFLVRYEHDDDLSKSINQFFDKLDETGKFESMPNIEQYAESKYNVKIKALSGVSLYNYLFQDIEKELMHAVEEMISLSLKDIIKVEHERQNFDQFKEDMTELIRQRQDEN